MGPGSPTIVPREIPSNHSKVNDCALDSKLLAKPDGDGRTVAHLAAFRGDQDVSLLRLLLKHLWGKDGEKVHGTNTWLVSMY